MNMEALESSAQEEVAAIRDRLTVTLNDKIGLNSTGAVEAILSRIRKIDHRHLHIVQTLDNQPLVAYGAPATLKIAAGVPRIITIK